MTDFKNDRPIPCHVVPVRVLACLRTNRLTVFLCPGQGMADGGIPLEIENSIVPFDLRMPNSEFFLLMRRDTDEIVKVLRVGEELDDDRFTINEPVASEVPRPTFLRRYLPFLFNNFSGVLIIT